MNRVARFQWLFFLAALLVAGMAEADSEHTYRQSLQMAANGQEADAVATLRAAAAQLSGQILWKERMLAAAALLELRQQRQGWPATPDGNSGNLALAAGYARAHPISQGDASWPALVLAVVLPGAGHAWQGRWRDAGVAAMLVWPMLLLTLWAARRRMGPVTVFFAMITVWLWSGTIFSSVSLAERASVEAYAIWWQGLWQASGLPGRPW